MNKFVALFLAFGAVFASASPVVFDKKLLEGKNEKFVSVLYGNSPVTEVGGVKNLRFMFLVPKLGAKFDGGFKSGLTPKDLEFLKLGKDEHMTSMFAFSDCKEWFAVGLTLFGLGGETKKLFKGVKGGKVDPVGTLDELVDFLHGKMTTDVFKGLLKLAPSSVVVHKLNLKFTV